MSAKSGSGQEWAPLPLRIHTVSLFEGALLIQNYIEIVKELTIRDELIPD